MLQALCPSLFGGLEPAATDALAARMHLQHHRHKGMIFTAGDSAQNVYVIVTGHVRLTRMAASGKEVAIGLLGPGEVLGEAALFGPRERQYTASAIGGVSLWSLGVDDVLRAAGHSARFGMNLARIAHERLVRVSTALEDVACTQVPERLLRLFDRMAETHGTQTHVGRYVGLELTHADIALLVGSTRETVSAKLASLTRSGALRIDNKRILIADRGRPGAAPTPLFLLDRQSRQKANQS